MQIRFSAVALLMSSVFSFSSLPAAAKSGVGGRPPALEKSPIQVCGQIRRIRSKFPDNNSVVLEVGRQRLTLAGYEGTRETLAQVTEVPVTGCVKGISLPAPAADVAPVFQLQLIEIQPVRICGVIRDSAAGLLLIRDLRNDGYGDGVKSIVVRLAAEPGDTQVARYLEWVRGTPIAKTGFTGCAFGGQVPVEPREGEARATFYVKRIDSDPMSGGISSGN